MIVFGGHFQALLKSSGLSSNVVFEELVLCSVIVPPLMKPFFMPLGCGMS